MSTKQSFNWNHPFRRSEFDWLATDLDGRVGFFSTAGDGPIPTDVLALDERSREVAEIIREHEPCCEADEVNRVEWVVSEFFEIARRGVFAFNWDQKRKVYVLIARPIGSPDLRYLSPQTKVRLREHFERIGALDPASTLAELLLEAPEPKG